jgi:hypothetical protein
MPEPPAQGTFDRLAAFRVVYAGIFAYVVLAVAALDLVESRLRAHFQAAVEQAARVNPAAGPVVGQIQGQVRALLEDSPWTRLGGVRVNPLVLGADARTPIYLVGITPAPPPSRDADLFEEANRLLPAIVTVEVDVPFDSLLSGAIWTGFGALLLALLFAHHRRTASREASLYSEALAARDATVERARSIQSELEKVRDRLQRLEPVEQAHAAEIAKLEAERVALQGRVEELAQREGTLRERTTRYSDLERERRALEDLLDEAAQDLAQKDGEIQSLQERLKNAARAPAGGGRTRAVEQLAKRVQTLYRNLEVDERAIQDIAALGDESLRLRAEECLKRLDEGSEAAGVRRKVGGLPSHLAIFELGFAGKGRIYYARGRQRPFRILAVGGKASQKQDLEYLSRVDLG